MEYGEIIKGAWATAWRHKNLWWLGLFAAAGSGGSSFNYSRSYSNTGGSNPFSAQQFFNASEFATLREQLMNWLPLIVAVIGMLLLIWVALLILQVAARGGLITQVDSAERGGRVSAATGWGDGFHRWWPLAVLLAFVALPTLIVMLFFALAAFVLLALPLYAGAQPGWGGLIALLFSFIGVMLLLIPVNIVLATMGELGSRAVMLDGIGPVDAFKGAWHMVRTRFKDVALMWLIILGLGFGFAVVLIVALLIVGVVGVVGVVASVALVRATPGALPFTIVLGVLAVLVLTVALYVVSAAFSTFRSALWTLFWRRATGRQPTAAAVPPGTPPAGWQPAAAGVGPMQAPPMYPGAPPAPPSATPPAPPSATPPAPPSATPPAPPAAPAGPTPAEQAPAVSHEMAPPPAHVGDAAPPAEPLPQMPITPETPNEAGNGDAS